MLQLIHIQRALYRYFCQTYPLCLQTTCNKLKTLQCCLNTTPEFASDFQQQRLLWIANVLNITKYYTRWPTSIGTFTHALFVSGVPTNLGICVSKSWISTPSVLLLTKVTAFTKLIIPFVFWIQNMIVFNFRINAVDILFLTKWEQNINSAHGIVKKTNSSGPNTGQFWQRKLYYEYSSVKKRIFILRIQYAHP